ncbi:MAG: hypothetical protein IJ525_01825 [Alphaproteobacteria bacterium]|nr:hypothetical protein [Alphaproteobacteria bacterium]
MKNNLENGRSMLEMLGVLAVIGVITIGGFGMINKMNDQRKANQIMDYAGDLANKARVLVRDYDNTATSSSAKKGYLFTTYLYRGKAYPSDLTYDTNNPYRFYGKNDEFYVVYAPNPNESYALKASLYVLGIFNLSETVCMELATKNWGSPSINGFAGLSVPNVYNIAYNNTTYFKQVDNYLSSSTKKNYLSIVGDNTYPAPMPAATAATYCADGATIYLTFK